MPKKYTPKSENRMAKGKKGFDHGGGFTLGFLNSWVKNSKTSLSKFANSLKTPPKGGPKIS
jgi:hypothetical protein